MKNKYATDKKNIERENRISEMFKFKGMKKRLDFLPALSPREDGFEKTNSLAIGDKFIPHKERIKIDRVSEKFD